ncbi:MAG TPA: DinB family protein [Streptosporangiaceae bacterium]|nr:DinB family protein [Streptosporangiaceae bacterium]
MPGRSHSPDEIVSILTDSPGRIAASTAGLDLAQLRLPPAPDEWSATEVLAHIRACADVWGTCIASILSEDRPTLRAVSPRTWIRKTSYLDIEFRPSLRSFTVQREELLSLLKPLSPAGWSRAATVIRAGKTLEETTLSYADRLASHELEHVEQIERAAEAVSE